MIITNRSLMTSTTKLRFIPNSWTAILRRDATHDLPRRSVYKAKMLTTYTIIVQSLLTNHVCFLSS